MFVKRVFYAKKFATYQYVSVVLISLGVSLFMGMKESKKGENIANSWFGVGLVIFNLLLDGFTNSTQDDLFVRFKELTSKQLMFGMNIASAFWMTIYLLYEGEEFRSGIELLKERPVILKDVLLFCIAGSVGQMFIFHTLENFGSRTLVTVNVTRKMFSILLSVFWFSHGIGLNQWLAVVLVFAGILLESGMKSKAIHVPTEESVVVEVTLSKTKKKKNKNKKKNNKKKRKTH